MARNYVSPTVMAAVEKILANENYIMALNEKELIFMMNQELPRRTKPINYYTLQRIRQDKVYAEDRNRERLYRKIIARLDDTKRKVKHIVLTDIFEKGKGWRRFKWLMEVMYADFNPKTRDLMQRMENPEMFDR